MKIVKANGIVNAVTEIPAGVGKIEVKSEDGKNTLFVFDEGRDDVTKYGMSCGQVVDGKLAVRLTNSEDADDLDWAKNLIGVQLAQAAEYEEAAVAIANDRLAKQAALKAKVDELFA